MEVNKALDEIISEELAKKLKLDGLTRVFPEDIEKTPFIFVNAAEVLLHYNGQVIKGEDHASRTKERCFTALSGALTARVRRRILAAASHI